MASKIPEIAFRNIKEEDKKRNNTYRHGKTSCSLSLLLLSMSILPLGAWQVDRPPNAGLVIGSLKEDFVLGGIFVVFGQDIVGDLESIRGFDGEECSWGEVDGRRFEEAGDRGRA